MFKDYQVSDYLCYWCYMMHILTSFSYCHCFRDQNEVDVRAVYHQLMDTYVTTDSDGDNEAGPSTSNASGARRYVWNDFDRSDRSNHLLIFVNYFRSTRLRRAPEIDWRVKCRDLLDVIWQSNDSEPFREPVDLIEHPGILTLRESLLKIFFLHLPSSFLQIT